jgi:hypothetical protein
MKRWAPLLAFNGLVCVSLAALAGFDFKVLAFACVLSAWLWFLGWVIAKMINAVRRRGSSTAAAIDSSRPALNLLTPAAAPAGSAERLPTLRVALLGSAVLGGLAVLAGLSSTATTTAKAGYFGSLLGTTLGTILLAALFFYAVSAASRRVALHGCWAFPVALYLLHLWGASPKIGFFFHETVGTMVGTLWYFALIRSRAGFGQYLYARNLTLSLGIVGAIYAFVGVDSHFQSARAAAGAGCAKRFSTDFPEIPRDDVEKYCECAVEPMIPETCRTVSLLWTNKRTEECAQNLTNRMSTPEGMAEMRNRQGFCIAQHLPEHRHAVLAKFVRALRDHQIEAYLASPDFAESRLPESRKRTLATCLVNQAIDGCGDRSMQGYSECISEPASDAVVEACLRSGR